MMARNIHLKTLQSIALGLLLNVSGVLAALGLPAEKEWGDLFGNLGTLGYYINTMVNNLIYFCYFLTYWGLVLLFLVLVGLIIFWLPLKLYPIFVQYYNLLGRVFGIRP